MFSETLLRTFLSLYTCEFPFREAYSVRCIKQNERKVNYKTVDERCFHGNWKKYRNQLSDEEWCQLSRGRSSLGIAECLLPLKSFDTNNHFIIPYFVTRFPTTEQCDVVCLRARHTFIACPRSKTVLLKTVKIPGWCRRIFQPIECDLPLVVILLIYPFLHVV